MKRPTEVELELLEAAARSWAGTPFEPNGRTKGAGVCCHQFVRAVYVEAGWLEPDLRVPDGPPGWSAAQGRSLIEEWVAASGRFAEVPAAERAPGDLLGFRVGLAVHHAGIQLRAGAVAHALRGHGACVSAHLPQEWSKRLRRAWRMVR